MRALRVTTTGGPDLLTVEALPDPEPGPGQVLIRVTASGVNYLDVYHYTGRYPRDVPFTLGVEAAGTVAALGPGVRGFAVGDPVAFASQPGAHAELALADAAQVVRIPEDIGLDTAAALMLQGMTAHFLATTTFPLASGHRALVHAAAGGVGLLLTQIAKQRGATVYGTVSTPEKAELASAAGADEVILYTETDFAAAVSELTDGAGVHVVYDAVGRDTFDRSLTCLRPRGLLALYGQASGPVEPFDPQRLNSGGSLYLTRPMLAHHIAERSELEWRARDLFSWVASGELDVRIGERHALDDARTAYERLESRQTTGKVLLFP